MGKLALLSGNKAVAYGVKLSRVQVVSAYPITPQTPIVEYIAEFVARGELKAEYIHPEGEHSAIAAALAAAIAGARSFTATCSQGLGYGFEVIAQAPAYRAPFVMAVANRTLGWYWALASDYSDSMTARDLGWIQYYVESCQECLDMVIQLYRIAEDSRVLLPAMMCLDGFHISHSSEPVDIPEQSEVDDFLPPRRVYKHNADPEETNEYVFPVMPAPYHTPYRRVFEEVLERSKSVIKEVTKEFSERFGRSYGLIEEYRTEGADYLLITMGSMTTAARRAVDAAREEGVKVGLIKVGFYRPFPREEIRGVIEREGVVAVGVVDRAVAHGMKHGPLGLDVLSTLYVMKSRPSVINFIAGMGGDDVSIKDFRKMINTLKTGCSNSCVKTVFVEHEPRRRRGAIEFRNQAYVPGSQLCAGCGALLITRHVLDVVGRNSVIVFPPNCVSAAVAMHFPSNYIGAPCVLANFAAAAAYARGIARAFRVRGKGGRVRVVAFAGDGCAADIGLQSLSSAAECGEPIIWITYDNEAYMNTGIQRSGTTPLKAWTTTTPVGRVWRGKREVPKDLISIVAAHKVPYIATASPAFINDLRSKVAKAIKVTEVGEGLAYIHIHSPCPTGWRFPESKTVEVARLAVLTGAWPLYEIDHGVLKLTIKPKELRPIKEYLRLQGRFAHLSDEEIEEIQRIINENWRRLLELDGRRIY